jgi:hypothetical protein
MSLFERKATQPNICKLRADLSYQAPEETGVYAWYYSPFDARNTSPEELSERIAQLCFSPAYASMEMKLNYGVSIQGKTSAEWTYSSYKKNAESLIQEVMAKHHKELAEAFQNYLVPWFTRPVYIGIAKNLRTRLFKQHYQDLSAYWQPEHPVSKLIDSQDGKVSPLELLELVNDRLSMGHSFALESRVRGFYPSDLFAFYIETKHLSSSVMDMHDDDNEEVEPTTDDAKARRAIERLFQIICVPICGRI